MTPKLFYNKLSPACRSTLLTIKALNIEVELISVNLQEKEQFSKNFLKINPQHTVPTLQDDSFILWDSHVINAYLVQKYGKDDLLYPKNLEKRSIIDQRLHFDSSILGARLNVIANSILREGAKSVTKDKADAMIQGYTLLETVWEHGKKYVCGDSLTIADFNIFATLSSANILVPLALNRFPKIIEWLHRMEELPYSDDANGQGLKEYAVLIKSKMGK